MKKEDKRSAQAGRCQPPKDGTALLGQAPEQHAITRPYDRSGAVTAAPTAFGSWVTNPRNFNVREIAKSRKVGCGNG